MTTKFIIEVEEDLAEKEASKIMQEIVNKNYMKRKRWYPGGQHVVWWLILIGCFVAMYFLSGR